MTNARPETVAVVVVVAAGAAAVPFVVDVCFCDSFVSTI